MHEAKDFFAGAFGQNASGFTDVERLTLVVGGCEAVAVRSCRELEGEYLDLLGKVYRKPVIPIGLLPPAPPPRRKIENTGGDEDKIFKWLDGQKVKSVMLAAFGSEVKLKNLQHGYVFVVLPSIIDQGFNARFLVEKGLAVEVERNLSDGSFKGDDVAKALRKGMVEKEGESIIVRAN
ncbi:hypothetical protein GIB67_027972 [Kingdonia uniflora]|uniref:Uncharacterized protein n=1 Tax=Kingdonia uniflora TaxID=39325 RepID=A0A7J7LH11_9MAGN|nr:hypothetical protein GIB67_027972 [Kingdonia uniflora]